MSKHILKTIMMAGFHKSISVSKIYHSISVNCHAELLAVYVWPENSNGAPLPLSPAPRKTVVMISWAVSEEEKSILESVRAAKSHESQMLESEITELEKESQRLRLECQKLWLWIQELATTLQDNKIQVPILKTT